MNLFNETTTGNRGFTMMEVISVLVIIGIIAAVAIMKFSSTDSYSVISEAEILKNNLRLAQIRAMGDTSSNTWGITVSGTSYTLTCTGATCPATLPYLPGDSSVTHQFASGISATISPNLPINFDNWGSPGAANITITLTGGGQTAYANVTQNTGFIQ
jgi:MSHA pilin protein MshC